MYYSYVEIEYVATSFSPARTDLALKLLRDYIMGRVRCIKPKEDVISLLGSKKPSKKLVKKSNKWQAPYRSDWRQKLSKGSGKIVLMPCTTGVCWGVCVCVFLLNLQYSEAFPTSGLSSPGGIVLRAPRCCC
jgi:hypothetical protein